jgi:hypothetical protein
MQSNHMERMHMWSSFKILIEDLRLSSNVRKRIIYALFLYSLVATLLFTIFKELKKKNLFFVMIAAIFHKRPGLATISLKVDHICIISIKLYNSLSDHE